MNPWVSGAAVFDTSAQSYFARQADTAALEWFTVYCGQFRIHLSPLTVLERMRGYWTMLKSCAATGQHEIERAIQEYLRHLNDYCEVLNFTARCAMISAALMALHPDPPSPTRRSHRVRESRQERLSRWRFDVMIAATALVYNLPLIHNNPQDFETLRALIEKMPERFPGVGPLNLISVKRLAA